MKAQQLLGIEFGLVRDGGVGVRRRALRAVFDAESARSESRDLEHLARLPILDAT